MKKYLRMNDVFDMQPIRLPASWSYEMVSHAVHAIDSHDKLVAMNKELLEALEAVIEWYDMEADHSIEPDFYRRMASCQVSEDMAREAIAKAKGTA